MQSQKRSVVIDIAGGSGSEERIMIIETRIAKLMGDISHCSPATDTYMFLDSELAALIAERNRLCKL